MVLLIYKEKKNKKIIKFLIKKKINKNIKIKLLY